MSASAGESSTRSARSILGAAASPASVCGARSDTVVASLSLGRRLVDEGPEPAERLDCLDELVKADRLDDVGVHAELIAPHQVLFFARRGQHHHGNLLQR